MHKRIFIISLFMLMATFSFSQEIGYWQQKLKYNIDVTLDDSAKKLKANLNLIYINNSPDTLSSIWFHCWPNAYKTDNTPFSKQLLKLNRTDFYFSKENQKGFLTDLSFKANGISSSFAAKDSFGEMIELNLPNKLLPGDSVEITTPFTVKLPYNFSRSGYIYNSYQITQWYPKPAVYDKQGWHTMPYLDQGEFYSEFSKYKVSINVPSAYQVEATGLLTDIKKTELNKQFTFEQDSVHDFAWFADKYWVTEKDSIQINGKSIEIIACHYNRALYKTNPMTPLIKKVLLFMSKQVGTYPYPVVKVVESPMADGKGMEYPTITLIDQPQNEKELEELLMHEIGHNWFYGILASNERDFPWMDEGMNSFYDLRYKKQQDKKLKQKASKRNPFSFEDLMLQHLYVQKNDLPINTPSEAFDATGYNLIVYKKAAQWLQAIEQHIGSDKFDALMHKYYAQWAFKHPQPQDFKNIASTYLHAKTDSFFNLLQRTGDLSTSGLKTRKRISFFNFTDPKYTIPLFISPIVGYNHSDRLMAGGILHNYGIPSSRLQFYSAPLIALESGKVNGMHGMEYKIYAGNMGSFLKITASNASFSTSRYSDPENKKYYTRVSKNTAGLKYQWPKNNSSTLYRYATLKSFWFEESALKFNFDSTGTAYSISNANTNRTLHRISYYVENFRKLYPYSILLEAEKGLQHYKIQATATYHFNYEDGGALDLRAFAGKFFYAVPKNNKVIFENERYQFNMTGPNGNEDYSYSDYFIGRNDFDNFYSQQIMERDGFFKVRTDLLSNKVGKDDNWLIAVNLSTTLPEPVNFLKVLPIKIPLRLFADFGTNSILAKNKSRANQFLYDAGLEFRCLQESIIFYFPLIYSKPFREYISSTIPEKKLFKTMSFTIRVHQFSIDKLFAKWL